VCVRVLTEHTSPKYPDVCVSEKQHRKHLLGRGGLLGAAGAVWLSPPHALQRTALNCVQPGLAGCDNFSIQHAHATPDRGVRSTHTGGFARHKCRMALSPRTTMGVSRTSLMGIALSPAILSQSCVSQISEEEVKWANSYDELTQNSFADETRNNVCTD
jgi:hypothetical protein